VPAYRVLALTIEIPWTVNLPAASGAPELRLRLTAPESIPYGPNSEPLTITRHGDGLHLDLAGTCRFVVAPRGVDVLCIPDPAADPEEVRRQALEHLIPRLLSRRHALVLHASSVVLPAGVVGFVAASGGGKSTLASSLARRQGAMLSDDSLVIDSDARGALARPLWSNVRLHLEDLPEDVRVRAVPAANGKAAITEETDPSLRFVRETAPLRALYVLGASSQNIEITRLAPRGALLALLRETYHLEFDDMLGVDGLMNRIEQLGLTHCTYGLVYPRDFSRLPEVCERVLTHAADL
jgi:hypothetical protein